MSYRNRVNPWVMVLLTVLLLAAMAGSCLLGAADIKASDIMQSPIFWRLRLPRVLMSVLVCSRLFVWPVRHRILVTLYPCRSWHCVHLILWVSTWTRR